MWQKKTFKVLYFYCKKFDGVEKNETIKLENSKDKFCRIHELLEEEDYEIT